MELGNIKNASHSQLKEIQLRELEILKHLKAVLDSHGIEFYIIGGTLIGAVRNKGFIPWDDDIDVMMKREDFEKFYRHREEWLEGTNFVLDRSNEKHNQHLTGMTFKDTTTTFINTHSINEDIQHSMSVDIEPLDYRPVGYFKRSLQIFYAIIFSLYNANRLPDHQGKLLRALAYLPLKIVYSKRLKYKIWSWAEKKMISLDDKKSNEVVELGVGYKALFRHDDASWFDGVVLLPFEDILLPAPKNYDKYLRAVVGNYMELPPEESRKPKHTTYLVDTERPYRKNMRQRFLRNKNEDC